jgi:glycosyltransferase involved in cell wall biosynthesis
VLETRVVRGSGGGPDKTILNSPRHLWAAGYSTICAYMHPPGDPGFEVLRGKAADRGAPMVSVPDHGPWDWRVVTRYLELCRRHRVNIWHGHDYKSNAVGLVVRRFWPMRLVTTVHGWIRNTARERLYCKVDKWCLPRYDVVLCVSEDLRDRCLAAGVPGVRCRLVENAVDTDEFARRADAAAARRRWGIAPGRSVIGAVGRLSPEKGYDLLIRSADQLRRAGHDVELLIAGTGPEESRLQALADELDLAGRVRLIGHVADPRSLYEALDLFALSSHTEGLPNVVLEAMAMGVAVVATRVAGVPRLIRDGECGVLVQPGCVEGLSAAIAGLLADPARRGRLAAAGRREVVDRYGFAARMEKVRDVYDGLLGGGPTAEGDPCVAS